MIAHKKQFKIAGAIWLVIVMTICQIVPAFAVSPLPTDENGNWDIDHYFAFWYIYNTDTQSYDFTNVTWNVTEDGLDFTFPYNTTGVTRVRLGLLTDLYNTTSNYYIDGLAFDGYAFYSNDRGTSGYVSTTSLTFKQFYYNGNSNGVYSSSSINSNPFSYISLSDTPMPFTGFEIDFQCSIVSGILSIHFDYISVNGEDISSKITVQNLDNAGDDLSNLAEELAVPTPDADAIFNGMDDAINHVNDSNYQSTYSFFKNDTGIMATYITIVLAMATLGYIFFGKRSA